jgi:diguanylate cyclase (GGDEF)-like protein/PAS domain S-box-containing protein
VGLKRPPTVHSPGARRGVKGPIVPREREEFSLRAYAYDLFFVLVVAGVLLAVERNAPESWRPGLHWLMLAPAAGLVFGALPAMIVRRRQSRIEKRAAEQEELVGLLLRDYAADRCDWLWSTDTEGRLRGASEKLAQRTGLATADLEGRPFLEILGPAEGESAMAVRDVGLAIRQHKAFFDIEIERKGPDGPVWWRLAGKPVFRDGRFGGFIGTASDITAEIRAKETVSFLAYNDGLTGLANRSHFSNRLNECVARLERYGTPFAVLYLDLDKFKGVNDSRGHQAGDKLLVEVGRRLSQALRETDLVARLGGDEFAVILMEDTTEVRIAALAGRLIDAISQPYAIDGDALMIGLSIGIAIAPINGTRPDQILRNADLALYRAKGEGGGRHCFFENRMDSEMRERRILEMEMAEALERGEFTLHYQPLVATADGVVSGFEALIRWNHPIRGLVPPSEFIPIAERSTLIGAIGEWTIREACRMLVRLPERCSVAVNLSTKHFKMGDVAGLVREAIAATGIDARRLELEITESLLIDNPDEMAAKLRELKREGIRIAMDDFGTGFSSLSYLLKFPFDKIKIDRSFVVASSEDLAAKEILRAIVNLAGTLEIAVTAEGVETQEQCEFLRETGCHLLQGYYFSRPVPEGDVAALLGMQAAWESEAAQPRRLAAG